MSYTAQLFESLLRASAEGSGSGSGSGSAAPSSSAGVSAPSSSSSAGVAEVPHELDECYAVINFQRKQIGELRERVASLEEQNASLRDAASHAHANVSAASAMASKMMSDEIAALRTTIQHQTEEIKKLREEKAALAKQAAEAETRIHSVRAAADREKQELAFKLGREAAFASSGHHAAAAFASSTVHASPFTAPIAEPAENLDSALAAAATPSLDKKHEGEDSNNDAPAAASPLTHTAGTVTASGASAGLSSSSSVPAGLDASTASLFEKQEQIKQQEALLLALKQQQVVNKVLTAQQRLQQQRMLSHGASMASMGQMGMMGSPAGQGQGPAAMGSFRGQQMMGQMGQMMGSPAGNSSMMMARHGTQMNMHRSMTGLPIQPMGQMGMGGPMGMGMGPYGGQMGQMGPGPMGMGGPMPMQPPMSPYGAPGGSQRRLSPSASMGQMGQMMGAAPPASGGGRGRRQVARRGAPPAAAMDGGAPYYGYDDAAGMMPGEEEGDENMMMGGGGMGAEEFPLTAGPGVGGHGGKLPVAVGFGPDGRPQELPTPGEPVEMKEMEFPPPGGYTLFRYPAPNARDGEGKQWPAYMVFFRPLVNNGIPILKHGRMGRPHPRLMWLDISEPSKPTLVWHEGNVIDPNKVKEKDRLRLIEIIDIKAGREGPNLKRTGTEENATKYICFNCEGGRTLDIELPTAGCRDWLFRKFADLFQAYANAQQSHLVGDDITDAVQVYIDGSGVPPEALAREAAEQAAKTPSGRGRNGSPRRGGSARAAAGTPMGGGASAGGGGGGRQRSRSPRALQTSASMPYY